MFNFLTISNIKIFIVVALVGIVAFTAFLYENKCKQLDQFKVYHDVTLAECEQRVILANKEINRQNELVKTHELKSEWAVQEAGRLSNELNSKLSERKTEIIKQLVRDESCEKQLELIKQDQKTSMEWLGL